MTVGAGFRRLTRTLRRLERAGWEIDNVRPAGTDSFCRRDTIRAIADCQADEDTDPVDPNTLDGETEHVDVRAKQVNGQTRQVSVHLRVGIDRSSERDRPSADPKDHEPPLHRDADRLRRLYRSCRTFEQMAERSKADVSAETLRRYMIDHEIHEPGGSATGAPIDGPRAQPVLTDGSGLPGDVTVERLIEAVAQANTVYDVQRQLDLDRERTAKTLRHLGLMDLVLGRLGTSDSREQREAEIRERLDLDR